MPIEALPESTSRAIGSTLVLNDAKSVVKELVDNALDARATTINVEISQNTLDVIQVKDNGTGIGVEDRQLLCKRGCTSKIRSLEDLSRLGGSFLGFRGEALASITELSNVVSVTTRVDGEIVGTSLAFGSSGMLSSSSASHPVGTTFRVQNFLHNIPVRKQTALKNSTKTLQFIKALLFSFAFARPNVRFSFKVLKAKNDKGNWTYAPSQKDTLTEVASKIVGQEIALETVCHSASSDDADTGNAESWTVEALLASRSTDSSKIRNATQYISIDGRPVTSDRGTVKEIVKLYKRYLQAAHGSSESSSIPRPFLCLQIKCPPESYDVNVEPAKDEVLFFRPTNLLSLVENLFKMAYPICEENKRLDQPIIEVSQGDSPSNMFDYSAFPTDDHTKVASKKSLVSGLPLLPQEKGVSLSSIAISNPFTIAAMTTRVLPKKMGFTEAFSTTSFGEKSKSPPSGENFAKPGTGTRAHRTSLDQMTSLPSPNASSDDAVPHQNPGPPLRCRPKVPTRQNAGPGDAAEYFGNTNDQRSPENSTLLQAWLTPVTGERRPSRSEREPQITPSRPGGFGETDDQEIQLLPNMDNLCRTSANSTSNLKCGPGQKTFRSPLKRPSNGRKPTGTMMALLSTPADQSENVASTAASDSTHPLNDSRNPGIALNATYLARLETPQQTLRKQSTSDESPGGSELADIMDFEYRKKAVIAQQRRSGAKFPSRSINDVLKSRAAENNLMTVRQSDAFVTSNGDKATSVLDEADFAARFGDVDTTPRKQNKSNPHHNRYLAAIKDLSHSHPKYSNVSPDGSSPAPTNDGAAFISAQEMVSTPSLPEDDPRAYFMRQRQRKGKFTLYRTRSSKLPLETIPAEEMTLHLVQTVDGFRKPHNIPMLVEHLSQHDRYIIDGTIACAKLDAGSSMSAVRRETILQLMKKTYRGPEGEDLGFGVLNHSLDVNVLTNHG